MGNKAFFFDRDGVLNVEKHYLYRKEDFIWIPGAIEAVQACNAQGYLVIVITNQSGVARGYYTEQDVQELHKWMNLELRKENAHIDAFYYCPHHPMAKNKAYKTDCDCRKPKPGMVNAACQRFGIDKAQSFFVGDKESDIDCAKNAGVRGILFQQGNLFLALQKFLGVRS